MTETIMKRGYPPHSRNLVLNEFNTQIPKRLASQTHDSTPPSDAIRCFSDKKHQLPSGLVCGLVCGLVLVGQNTLSAEERILVLPPAKTRYYLALSPSLAMSYRDTEFDSSFGGELHLVSFIPDQRWAIVGLSLGATRFASHDATRLHLDFYGGIRTLGELPIGLSLGPAVDLFTLGRTRVGFRTTLWAYTGISPFLRFTSLRGLGAPESTEIEIGLSVPFPAFAW